MKFYICTFNSPQTEPIPNYIRFTPSPSYKDTTRIFKYTSINQAMKKKVHCEKRVPSTPLSSTSRHELKELKEQSREQDNSSAIATGEFNLSSFKLKFFVGQLAKKIKFLAPPLKKPESVLEEWELELRLEESNLDKKKPDEFCKQTLSEEISNRYQTYSLFSMLQGVLLIFFFWLVTVSLVFQQRILVQVFVLVALVSFCQIASKIKIAWDQKYDESTYQIHWSHDFLEPTLLFLAAIVMIIRFNTHSITFEYIVLPVELVFILIKWQKIGHYFSFVRLYAQQNKFRKELRIIQLFGFTIVMAHIFALIIYAMSYFQPAGEGSWITKANLQDRPWFVLYIYSFYWANTTMVTVGYGDLTPNNQFEVLIVTFIQIAGTAIFGYMINVIGITVNEISKKNHEFEEHESTIFKLQNHYHLSRELCYRMKNDIRKKEFEMKEMPLKTNQEGEFLDYIDCNLKDEFVLETNMRVIKKCIFFLTHFTINFQNEIALKLIRRIYKPDEVIHVSENEEKQLVIIDSGKVSIYYKRYHHNQEIIRLARIIKPEAGKPTLNVYGYSSLILNRNINLKAVTQETTTAYILKRSDITESMLKSMLDFQSFNELREKIQQSVRIELIQAPALKDHENHFIPNSYLLMKKIKNLSQARRKVGRGRRRSKMELITLKHYQNKTMLYIPSVAKSEKDFLDIDSFLEIQEQLEKDSSQQLAKPSKYLVMDQSKCFTNFLKFFNLPVVAKEYENACAKKSYLSRTIKIASIMEPRKNTRKNTRMNSEWL